MKSSPRTAADCRPPRLDQVESWVFDLDNTLYPASSSLFPQIDLRMRRFIAGALGLDEQEAFVLQKRYYHQYGTTLRGLMLAHAIEPDEFLAYVHDVDCGMLDPSVDLDRALTGLPGRKIIFTNGTERHALNVLERLGLTRHFEGIFDIRAADYLPKPNAETYARMAQRHRVDARRAAMFEDLPQNLLPAAEAGMATVLVREAAALPDWVEPQDLSHVHHVTDDLAAWLLALPPRHQLP